MNLLVSDYDGTLNPYTSSVSGYFASKRGELTNSQVSIINCNIDAINRLKGYHFMLSTGRSYKDIKKEIDRYHIPYDYLSTNDGTTLVDNKGNIISNVTIDRLVLNEIVSLQHQYNYFIKYIEENGHVVEVMIIQSYKTMQEVNKKLSRYIKNFPGLNCIVNSSITLINIGGEKSRTIKMINRINHYDRIVTIGNDYNDLRMLKDYEGYLISSSQIQNEDIPKIDSVKELILKIN